MKLCKFFYRLVRNFLIVFFVVIALPGLPPKTQFDFKSFIIEKPLNLTGPLERNNLLDNAERLFEGQVHGPETLLKRDNEIYATIHGGEVIKITGDHITHVAKFGKPCEGLIEEDICGRPLGMAFDTIGNNLIVADAYYGIWMVDLKTGKKQQLIAPSDELDGQPPRKAAIFNSIAVAKNGDIYWTDSSSDFKLYDGIYSMLANPSGRLFRYNRVAKKSEALLDELYFANGLALSPDEAFIIVSETAASRLTRYYLKGNNKGQKDVFIDRLPGATDNLTPDANGIWVPLVMSIDAEHPALWQSAANAPYIRRFLCRTLALIEAPFQLIERVYPNPYTKWIVHKTGHFEALGALQPARTTILRIDWNGKIVGSLHGFDRSVQGVAHVLEDGDYLYLGSFANKYVGRVTLPKSYKSATQQQTTTKPEKITTTTTTTTTTPKPAPSTTTTKATTQAPKTTQKPTTTQPPTTTPPVTTTEVPKTTAKPTTTQKPATQPPTTQKPATTTAKAQPTTKSPPTTTSKPAPVREEIPDDTKNPSKDKLKVIKKGGEQGEL